MPSRMLHNRARALRRGQTDAERLLWSRLHGRQVLGVRCRRQSPIGACIADFCAPECRLIIELDGSQHAAQSEAEARRTAALGDGGYRMPRFWDSDVLTETEVVLEKIASELRPAKGRVP